MDKKKEYKSRLEYNNSYNRKNYKSFAVRYNIQSEADIIEWINKKHHVKEYITSLIRADMNKSSDPEVVEDETVKIDKTKDKDKKKNKKKKK